jgi:hypothetical protein
MAKEVKPYRPAETFGQFLMEAMTNPDIPADKLMALGQLRREVLQDQAREKYQEAFAAFQAELPEVERDGTIELVKEGVSKGRLPFTTYEAMYRVLRPLLAKHGFSIQFTSQDDKDLIRVTGTLAGHGWEKSSSYAMPPDQGPGRNALQARGSTRQYCKRYITDDLCNIVRKGRDNDGRGAQDLMIEAPKVRELERLIKATKTDVEHFLKMMLTGVDSLGEIRERDYPRLVLALKDREARIKAAEAKK